MKSLKVPYILVSSMLFKYIICFFKNAVDTTDSNKFTGAKNGKKTEQKQHKTIRLMLVLVTKSMCMKFRFELVL